jgi:hypothetical protein
MSYYWAKFKTVDSNHFRFDTRVYLDSISKTSETDICIGAVVGKNPGSAKASDLSFNDIQPINLGGDKLLPTVRNIIFKAYKQKGQPASGHSYIQVLNLFYLCNPDLFEAIACIRSYRNLLYCDTEKKQFPWIWYVWGGKDDALIEFKQRFENIRAIRNFYYDKNAGTIVSRVPKPDDFAKHTQGLQHDLVVPYISSIL